MSIFIERFNIRWSDVDANKHVGNSSYMNFCSQTRMSFLNSKNIGVRQLSKWNLAPVLLKEEFIFYREIYMDQTVFVTLEITGLSEDSSIFEFTHKIYDSEGVHHATSKVQGVWIDMIQRKRNPLSEEMTLIMLNATDKENLKNLTIENVKDNEKPINIDPELLINNYHIH